MTAQAAGAGASVGTSPPVRAADRWRLAGIVVAVAWVLVGMALVGDYIGILSNDDPQSDPHGYVRIFGVALLVVPGLFLLASGAVAVRLLVRRHRQAWTFHWAVGATALPFFAFFVLTTPGPSGLLGTGFAFVTIGVAWFGSRAWRRAARS